MPPLPDDDPEKWTYQGHTRAKHEALRYYLDVWTRIVSNENYPLRVYDCFAGRGDYFGSDGTSAIQLDSVDSQVDYPGSPQVMLDVLTKRSDLFDSADLYLLEPNDNNRAALKENLENTDIPADNVNYAVSGKEFGNIFSVMPSWQGFALFFMDPFGFSPLDYDIVSRITGTKRFDCIITLMTKELIRWQDSDKHNDAFETLYGTPDWKQELKYYNESQLETAEAEYYCSRLEQARTEYTLAYMTTRSDSIELMYDLILTTNDEKGLEVMKESMVRCGSDYALAYAPQRSDIGGGEQTTLTGGKMMTQADTAKSYLVTRFAGQELEFETLFQRVLQDPERRYDNSLKKDYRQYLMDLHDQGEVLIPDREPGSDHLPDRYVIQFPEIEQDELD